QTLAQLQASAAAQASSETSAAEAPYQSQVDLYGKQSKQAVGDITSTYANLLPQVSAAATQVQNYNTQALGIEQSIYQAAGNQLNQISQQQAKEAQDMAQQVGGPVGGASLFTEGASHTWRLCLIQKRAGCSTLLAWVRRVRRWRSVSRVQSFLRWRRRTLR